MPSISDAILLRRRGHQRLDLPGRRARECDENVGEGDVDLRLLLAGSDEHGEQAEQQARQREQRRDLGVEELPRDSPGDTQPIRHGAPRHAAA